MTFPVEKYLYLRDFVLKLLLMFRTTYICERTLSKYGKSKERNRITDEVVPYFAFSHERHKSILLRYYMQLQKKVVKCIENKCRLHIHFKRPFSGSLDSGVLNIGFLVISSRPSLA